MGNLVKLHAVALTGALSFLAIGLLLPWLFGPLAACLTAALCGVRMRGNKPVADMMRTILGVAVGATITVTFLQSLLGMWDTLMLIPLMTALIGFIGVPYFQRLWGYDWATSYYASMPGGLQDMLLFGEEAGGNVRAMSLIHATRVLVIVMVLPILLRYFWDADLSRPPGQSLKVTDPFQVLVLILCALIGWRVAKRVSMFGASILGPLILAALASIAGVLQTRPPAEAIWMAQYFIALSIGVKYVGITGSELRRDVIAGIGFCIILIMLTIVFVSGVQLMGLAPPMETILALAPGGQAELVVLALIVGADMGFVVAHHIFRIFIVIIGAPIFARLFR